MRVGHRQLSIPQNPLTRKREGVLFRGCGFFWLTQQVRVRLYLPFNYLKLIKNFYSLAILYRLVKALSLGTMDVKHALVIQVHSGSKGGRTGYGSDTRLHPDHWVSSSQKITCYKYECMN